MAKHYQTLSRGMTFEEAIEGFLRSRKLGNGGANKPCAERTRYEYEYDLRLFFRYFKDKEYYDQISEPDVLNFLEHHQNKDISDASRKKVLRSLRAFFRWVEQDRECQKLQAQPWNKLLPKIGNTKPRMYIPTPEVMNTFLQSFDTNTIWGLRDFTVTSILIDCGPRIGEICNLDLTSVLWEQNQMLLTGKTGQRVVPLNADITLPHLKRWVRERKRFETNNALFVTRFGGRCNPGTFDQSFGDNRQKSGVGTSEEGSLTPHTVRHYFCTHFLVNGGSLPVLQAITGHTNLSTLQIYLHMATQLSSVAQEHANASPLRSLSERVVRRRKVR